MSKSKKLVMPKLILDSVNLDSWSIKINGFLIATQNWVLHGLEKQLKRDRSSSPEVLAGIRVVKQVIPCPVELYCMDTFYLLRFRLGKGNFEYTENLPKNELVETLFDVETRWDETFDPRTSDVWTIVHKDKPFEKHYLYSMLQKAIDSMIRDEKDNLVKIRDQVIRNLGFRPIEVRTPSGNPDVRIEAVARINLSDGERIRLSASNLVSDMKQASGLIVNCPDGIEQVMQRARLLYVNGYYEWEFFTIAIHYAVLALEASLRLLYDEWLGTDEVEVTSEIEGREVEERRLGPRENILKWANRMGARKVKTKGAMLPRNKSHLLDHAVRIGVLSLWERERCDNLLRLRDIFSHPMGTFTEWISWAFDDIAESCLWINLMWARFYKSVPYEFAWEHGPVYQSEHG